MAGLKFRNFADLPSSGTGPKAEKHPGSWLLSGGQGAIWGDLRDAASLRRWQDGGGSLRVLWTVTIFYLDSSTHYKGATIPVSAENQP